VQFRIRSSWPCVRLAVVKLTYVVMILAALVTAVVATIAVSREGPFAGPVKQSSAPMTPTSASSSGVTTASARPNSGTTTTSSVIESAPDTRGFLRIKIFECVPFLVTDPEGRRTGIDPATGNQLNEIPEASYLPDEFIADPENSAIRTPASCIFELIGPVDGTYAVQLASTTGLSYAASFFEANHAEGTSQMQDSARLPVGSAPKYLVNYQGGAGQAIQVRRLNPAAALQ
jgi:hypothetical protein